MLHLCKPADAEKQADNYIADEYVSEEYDHARASDNVSQRIWRVRRKTH